MSDTLMIDVTTTSVQAERRRPGRIQNSSPELIALMRQPTPSAVARIELYDAPNFVPTSTVSIACPHPAHFVRMVGATGFCVLAWSGAFASMIVLWG